jgi:hypothetical protein
LEDEMEGRVASIGMMRNEKNFSRKSQGKWELRRTKRKWGKIY